MLIQYLFYQVSNYKHFFKKSNQFYKKFDLLILRNCVLFVYWPVVNFKLICAIFFY